MMNDSLRCMSKQKRILQLLSYALMVVSPFLLLGSISLVLGSNAFHALPVWTDELDYWRALYSWQQVGFDKGFSGMFEAFPIMGTLGVRGITPILLYGGFAKLFGLGATTIVIANAVWISLGALTFCLLVKPKPIITLLFTALLLVYVPIVLYCITSMTELFNYALILFYLAFLFRYHQKRNPCMLALCVFTAIVGCVYRITYCLLFVPLILDFCRYRFGWRMVISTLTALVIWVLCYTVVILTTAPYIQGFLYNLLRAEDVDTFTQMLWGHTKFNLIDYFSFAHANLMENCFRILYCGVTALCLVGSFVRVEKVNKQPRVHFGISWELLTCFALLLIVFGMVAVGYETNDWSDFRMLAPFLWAVVGYLLVRRRFIIPVATLTLSAATLVLMLILAPVGAFNDAARFERAPHNASITEAANHIVYESNAKNPLTNTVRIDIPGLQVVEELAPGLGLQYGWFTTESTGKSRWIMTDHLKCIVEGYEHVFSTRGVKVFRLIESNEVP